MRSLHHIKVDRADGVGSFRTAVDFLRAGEVVGIFPEATISRAMELKELKTGAVRIAAAAGVPVVPVALWGTQRLMTKDHPRDFSRGTPIRIVVGPPLRPTGADPVAETAELKAAMAGLLDTAIASYADAHLHPGAWWVPASKGGIGPEPGPGGGPGRRGAACPGAPPVGRRLTRGSVDGPCLWTTRPHSFGSQ